MWVLSPEGVLHPVVEVLFGEARELTARIVRLFDWSGKKNDGAGFLNVHEFAHGPIMVYVISHL